MIWLQFHYKKLPLGLARYSYAPRLVYIELHLVRVRASPTLVGTEPMRFRVEILEIESKSNPMRFGCGFTTKTRH